MKRPVGVFYQPLKGVEHKSRVIGPMFVLLKWEGGFHAESRTQEHIHGSRDRERDAQQLRPEQWGLRLDGSRRHNKRRSSVCFISEIHNI